MIMTIKDLIQEYKENIILKNLYGQATDKCINIYLRLMEALERGVPYYDEPADKLVQWQIELKQVKDYDSAALVFFDMSIKGASKKITAILSYYYLSKILAKKPLSNFYRMRALIVYKRSSIFINYAEKAMTQHYAGNLNNRNFFDILLLSDVYNGWNGIFGEDIFAQLKEESTRIASIHQYFTKDEVLEEGKKACKSLNEYISKMLESPYFPFVEQ